MGNGETNYNDTRLRQEHPQLARAFEGILLKDKALSHRLKYIYYSDFKTAQRDRKTISLQRIINVVESAGYKIEINVYGTYQEIKATATETK